MSKYFDSPVTARINFLRGDDGYYGWGRSVGWNDGIINSVFRRQQVPGPRDLALLAIAERVNLTWLLTGEGPPYLVLPLPELQDLVVDGSANYYLFPASDGIPPPLVCVRHVLPPPDAPPMPATRITVYSGLPVELMRAVDWLGWKGKPIYLAQDPDGAAARLRAGLLGNRALIDDGNGLLEGSLLVVRPDERAPHLVTDAPNHYLTGPALPEEEREWMMRWRELTEEQRAALLLIARGLVRDD